LRIIVNIYIISFLQLYLALF